MTSEQLEKENAALRALVGELVSVIDRAHTWMMPMPKDFFDELQSATAKAKEVLG